MYLAPIDKLDELERLFNNSFHDDHENKTMSHIAVQVQHIDLSDDNDKRIVVHYPEIFKDDSDIHSMFS
jgi:hypothetical protein